MASQLHDNASVASATGATMTGAFEPGLEGLLPELRWRGMFHAASEGLEARLGSGRPIAGYNGFDP